MPALPPHRRKKAPPTRQFQSVYEKEWKWRQASFGSVDEDSDDTAGNDHLPDVSAAAQAERLKVWTDVLHQLDAIDPAELSPDNRINLAVYRPQVENLAAEVRLRGYEMPFNSDSSFWSDLGFMARQQMHGVGEYDAYIARLNDVPRYFDQQIDNMRAGLARGFSVPRAVLDGRDVSIAAMAELKDPDQPPISTNRSSNCRRRSRPPNSSACAPPPPPPSASAWSRPTPNC